MGSFDITTLARPTVVEIWAPACAECKAMQPSLDATAVEFADTVDLVMVNAAVDIETVRSLGVKGTPTLIGIREGEEVYRYTGRRSPAELEKLFSSVSAGVRPKGVGRLDMMLRVGVGVALLGAGLLSGPAWALVVIGVAVAAVGIFPMVGR